MPPSIPSSEAPRKREKPAMKSGFSVQVAKENLKFSAAHFMAYPGFREALHGHNYQVGVCIEGRLGATGYVLDFGLIKQITKEIVDRLDERTIIPANSDCLTITRAEDEISVLYGNDHFAFPVNDVVLLPIMHSSAEELARYLWCELRNALEVLDVLSGIISIEITVAEAPGQAASYREEMTKF
jgi:dihydroneopterin triphosphate aldolase (PTPS-III) / 6-pyruvoyltetrahydropterin synthase